MTYIGRDMLNYSQTLETTDEGKYKERWK